MIAASWNPTSLTIVAVAVLVGIYSVCAFCRKREVSWDELMVVAINVVGVVTGFYMFVDSFEVAAVKPQNAIFSAIAGVCMVVIFGQKSLGAFVAVLRREIQPK